MQTCRGVSSVVVFFFSLLLSFQLFGHLAGCVAFRSIYNARILCVVGWL